MKKYLRVRISLILLFLIIVIIFIQGWIGYLIVNVASLKLSKTTFSGVGNYTIVINKFEESREINHANTQSSPLLALAYYSNGDINKAISQLSKNVNQNYDEVSAYWLGELYWKQGHRKDALRVWKSTRYYDDSLELARRFVENGDYIDAKRKYEYLLDIDPTRADVQFEYGKLLWDHLDSGNSKSDEEFKKLHLKIQNALSRAVQLEPTNPEYLSWLGWYHFRVNNDDNEAVDYLKQAVLYNQDHDPWIYYRLGQVYDSLGEYSASVNVYQQAQDYFDEDNIAISKSLAKALFRVGEANEAIHLMETVVQMDPTLPENHFLLAIYYSQNCSLDEAQVQFEMAVKLDSEKQYLDLKEKAENSMADCK